MKVSQRRRVSGGATLRQFELFEAVLDARGFTTAAKRLGVTQSAASHAVAQLEKELGLTLIKRTGSVTVPTNEGLLVRQQVAKIESAVLELRLLAIRLRDLGVGRLHVGSSLTFGTYVVAATLGEFRRQHPGADIRLAFANGPTLLADLEAGKHDIAILPLAVADADRFQIQSLGSSEIVFVAARHHPLAGAPSIPLAAVAKTTSILAREPGSLGRDGLDVLLREAAVSDAAIMQLEGTQALLEMAKQGLGVAVVPAMAAREDLAAGRLARLNVQGFPLAYEVVACWKTSGPMVDAFLELLKARERGVPADFSKTPQNRERSRRARSST